MRYVALFLLALGVRIFYLAEWHDTPLFSVLVGDGRQYDLWAREIAGGEWFGNEVFYQAPFYPYFMAVVYSVFGHDLWALRLVQVVLGSTSCVLVALAGRRFFGRGIGLVAGVILALYAPAIYFDGLVQKGVFGSFFMALLLYSLGELSARRAWPWLAGAGVTLGCFALARENALVLPPIVALWLACGFREEPASRRAVWAALLMAGIAVILAPVGLRNQSLGGDFLPTTSQLGPNLFIGNNPDADGTYAPLVPGRAHARYERQDSHELAERDLGRELTPAEVSRYWRGRALGFVREQPLRWLGLLARKAWLVGHGSELMDTDSIEALEDESVLLRILGTVLHFGTLLPLALLGVWTTRREWKRLWALYAIAIAMALAVAVFFVMARYRHPLVPIAALFAAAGIAAIGRAVLRRDGRRLAAAAAALAVALGVFNWPLAPAIDPRAVTRYSLGLALAEEGRLVESRAQLELALAREPAFVDALVRLGDVRTQQGDPAGALPQLRLAVQSNPGHAGARVALGTALLRLGDPDEAELQYREAIRLDRREASAYNNLAVLAVERGRYEEAVALWQSAIEIAPGGVDAYVNLGKLLLALGDRDGARRRFEQASAIGPRDPTRP